MTRENLLETPNKYTVSELGVDVLFGTGNGLRHKGNLNIYDILAEAKRNGVGELRAAKALGRQLYLSKNGGRLYRQSRKSDMQVRDERIDWKGLGNIIVGKSSVPFFVGQSTLAIVEFGLSPDTDPTPFINNVQKYEPPPQDLKGAGLTQMDLEKAREQPAIVAGSAVLIHWDGIDENRVLLRQRRGGYYEGKKSIPGGHGEGTDDVVSLAEVVEETGVEKAICSNARPLGTADQVLFARDSGQQPGLKRYLNMLWYIDVSFDKRVYEAEKMGWKMIDDDEVYPDDFTPVAKIALEMAQFL